MSNIKCNIEWQTFDKTTAIKFKIVAVSEESARSFASSGVTSQPLKAAQLTSLANIGAHHFTH